jgi:hypothetical protein
MKGFTTRHEQRKRTRESVEFRLVDLCPGLIVRQQVSQRKWSSRGDSLVQGRRNKPTHTCRDNQPFTIKKERQVCIHWRGTLHQCCLNHTQWGRRTRSVSVEDSGKVLLMSHERAQVNIDTYVRVNMIEYKMQATRTLIKVGGDLSCDADCNFLA